MTNLPRLRELLAAWKAGALREEECAELHALATGAADEAERARPIVDVTIGGQTMPMRLTSFTFGPSDTIRFDRHVEPVRDAFSAAMEKVNTELLEMVHQHQLELLAGAEKARPGEALRLARVVPSGLWFVEDANGNRVSAQYMARFDMRGEKVEIIELFGSKL